MLRPAVERQFEIVGEAFAGLRRVDPDLAARIPDLSRMVAFRNVLVHGYATVDDRLIWDVGEGHLPGLIAVLACLPGPAAHETRECLPGASDGPPDLSGPR